MTPPIIHTLTYWDELKGNSYGRIQLFRNAFLFWLGFVGFIAGSFASLRNIIKCAVVGFTDGCSNWLKVIWNLIDYISNWKIASNCLIRKKLRNQLNDSTVLKNVYVKSVINNSLLVTFKANIGLCCVRSSPPRVAYWGDTVWKNV